MGASLVAQAVTHWSHVSHQAFRALIKMALTAKDQSTRDVPAALYFGGHDGLVHALLYKTGTSHKSKLRAVREAVSELEHVGAVLCTEPAMSGSNAVYKLTLDAIPLPAKSKRKKSNNFAREAEDAAPPQTINQAEPRPPTEAEPRPPTEAEDAAPPEAEDAAPPPYKEEEPLEEPLEELREEKSVDLRADLAATRAETSEQHPPKDSSSSTCANPGCLLGNVIDDTAPKGKRVKPCPTCRPDNVIPFGRRTA